MRATLFFCACLVVLGACSDGGGARSMNVDAAAPVQTCSATSGQTACGQQICGANEWCEQILCLPGCQSDANCATGQFCDKVGATGHAGAGVCRACAVQPACSPLGNYQTIARASNPQACSGFSLGNCSVTQGASPTALNVGCDGGSPEFRSIQCAYSGASCSCTASFSVGGTQVSLTTDFTKGLVQLSGNGVLCEYSALR